jgi:hypothetical protein
MSSSEGRRWLRWLVLCSATVGLVGVCSAWAQPAVQNDLSEREAFMLMFGKGNGAMRVLCALEKAGLLTHQTRTDWSRRLETLLSEPADTETDRRHARIGMAFADRRASLCPGRSMTRTDP